MRFKIVLRIFAESETTGESVELCPGGLVEEYPSKAYLFINLGVLCEQGWGVMSRKELKEFFSRLEHETEAVARVLGQREQTSAIRSERERSSQKAASRSKADVR